MRECIRRNCALGDPSRVGPSDMLKLPAGQCGPASTSVKVYPAMWFKDLKTRKAAEVGISLADNIVASLAEQAGRKRKKAGGGEDVQLQRFLAQVDLEARPLQLGIFRRAKLANTFKWRLLDKGVDPGVVNELTRMLLLRLSAKSTAAKVNT